jgi:Ni/Fe-hydrogenase subunit HybB-like protein
MSAHVAPPRAEPVGGPLFTPAVKFFAIIAAIGGLAILYRFAAGLGAATALSDGYPWGIWIAFDVVTGTALACGGYAIAILVYIVNRGQYHPLIRPAILTSALGYSMAGLSICFDVGRPWLLYRVPLWFRHWNFHSVLFEVAMCVMAYVGVCWLEVSPAFLEKFEQGPPNVLQKASKAILPPLKKAMPWIVALGLLLPTMHQSSLGSLMLLTGRKLHPIWSTPLLPLLFLISVVGMGFAAVVFESTLSSRAFKRPRESEMLAGLAKAMIPILLIFSVLRVADLALRGRLGLLFVADRHALLFWLEMIFFLAPVFMLRRESQRLDSGNLFRAAMLMMTAGGLYRFDTFLLAFHPGVQYSYFPSVLETLTTVGIVAFEVLAYIVVVKMFPILSGSPRAAVQG